MALEIRDNAKARRFELEDDGTTALLAYDLSPGIMAFTHTEVPAAIGGRGHATRLARFGLDHARAAHLKVVPLCPVVVAFIKRHPEYQDLVISRAKNP